jgi:GNAT superfamily N-acetyltransferase
MITIRPFDYSDTDYQRALAINAAVFNDSPDMIEEWQHDDQVRSKDYPFYRDVVLRDSLEIAYVETFQNQFAYHPQKYTCYIFVDPAHDAADVRPAIWEYILKKLEGEKLIGIMSGMLDDNAEAMRFFADYGFERVAEEKLSKLDITHFNAGNYEAALTQVRASGIEIVTLKTLQAQDSDWQQKLYDLDVTVNRDIPSVGEKHYPDRAEWVKMRLETPNFDPNGWFVALDTGRLVGQSQGTINRESQPVQFMTGVTTVRREYRRRGIATALKLHIIRFAQENGVQEIFTTNDSQNPMYQLNLKLGFTPQPSWVRVEKTL